MLSKSVEVHSLLALCTEYGRLIVCTHKDGINICRQAPIITAALSSRLSSHDASCFPRLGHELENAVQIFRGWHL